MREVSGQRADKLAWTRRSRDDERVASSDVDRTSTVHQLPLTLDDEKYAETFRERDPEGGSQHPGPEVRVGFGRQDRDDRVLVPSGG